MKHGTERGQCGARACVCVCDKPRKVTRHVSPCMVVCTQADTTCRGWMCMTTHHSKEMNRTHTNTHSKGSMLCQSIRLCRGAHTQGGNHAPRVANLKLMTIVKMNTKALPPQQRHKPQVSITANQIPTTIVLPQLSCFRVKCELTCSTLATKEEQHEDLV